MTSPPPAVPELFLVYPANRKFVSGATTYEQVERQLTWVMRLSIVALVAALAVLSFFSGVSRAFSGVAGLVCLFAPIFAVLAWWLRRKNRLLLGGQFLDAEIVRCEGSWHFGFSTPDYWLELMYTFDTPAGKPVEQFLKVKRIDLHNFVPPPGTPLRVRYVNDSLFRVM